MASDDSYLRSLSSLSCGLLDGLCQAEDDEEFSAILRGLQTLRDLKKIIYR